MTGVREIRGLRYPDEYVVKFFFKNGLHESAGSMLELGCGNGNNLLMFYEYGWDVIGVDIDAASLADAEHNLALLGDTGRSYRLVEHDLSKGLDVLPDKRYDVVMIPNVMHNLRREDTQAMFQACARFVKQDTFVFVRTRSIRDYRFGRGKKISDYSFILEAPETGELGTMQTFYYEYELVDLLRDHLNVRQSSLNIFLVEFENVQSGMHISRNSDIVIWGQCDAG
jgi:ubiquinone/menaquinone biosynthesis C-methylase UbiE